ncbi:DUF937 domain-containing protein [Nocardia brasiliensis]|uniref:DUF937 domain-containing protein n=1 Tax=Nocardia brasiliensis TaxID=37326 RepID=A0A6G9XKS9_NOCBR|nr:DUF937 domain-containing protein [Nocardia brasiliensis]QIS01514.1 DUF937 domain-containing protein [Nocardia brasiliensis]
MTSFDDLLSQVPIAQIAEKLGVDQSTATAAVAAALPTLLGGLQANATKPEGAASLVDALDNHGGLVEGEGAVDIDKVDVNDGSKIVENVFGTEKNTVISALGATEGTGGNDLIAKLMPILAPIVLAYLAKQMSGGGAAAPQQTQAGGGIGDILGGLLGGSGKSGGIGGAIGEALAKNAGGALGNVLGGLFGGKR